MGRILNNVTRGGDVQVYDIPLFIWMEWFVACHDIYWFTVQEEGKLKKHVNINMTRYLDGTIYMNQECLILDIFEVIRSEWTGVVNG